MKQNKRNHKLPIILGIFSIAILLVIISSLLVTSQQVQELAEGEEKKIVEEEDLKKYGLDGIAAKNINLIRTEKGYKLNLNKDSSLKSATDEKDDINLNGLKDSADNHITYENGKIKEMKLDLEDSKQKRYFRLEDKKYDIEGETKIELKEGVINSNTNKDSSITINQILNGKQRSDKISFSNKKNLNGNNQIEIETDSNTIKGKDFEVSNEEFKEGIKVGDEEASSEISIVDKGYNLGDWSKAEWDKIGIETGRQVRKKGLLLTKNINAEDIPAESNLLSRSENSLKAKGSIFNFNLLKGNNLVPHNFEEGLEIDYDLSESETSIQNRKSKDLPPLLEMNKGSALIKNRDFAISLGSDKINHFGLSQFNKQELIPLEFKPKNSDNSYYFTKDGDVINSDYKFTQNDLTSQIIKDSLKGDNPSSAFNDFYTEKVQMDSEGNIKYPLIKYLSSKGVLVNDPKTTSRLISNSGDFNKEDYYLDESSLKLAFKDYDENSFENKFDKLSQADPDDVFFGRKERIPLIDLMSTHYSDDTRVSNSINNLLTQAGENIQQKELTIKQEEEKLGLSETVNAMNYIKDGMAAFKLDPKIQSKFVESLNLNVDYSQDRTLLPEVIKSSTSSDTFRRFLGKYGFEQDSQDYKYWQDVYFQYKGFDKAFPEYNQNGLTDNQKLAFVMSGAKNSRDNPKFEGISSFDSTKGVLNSYFKKKNDVIFSSSDPLHLYSYSGPGFDIGNEYISRSFNTVHSKNVDNIGFSLRSSIKSDISDPKNKGVFAFHAHGSPNNLHLGSKFLVPITISDQDIADSLYNRYMRSSNDPQSRSFGGVTVMCQSCFSGDFNQNVQNILQSKLRSQGINPNNINLPNLISVGERGDVAVRGLYEGISKKMGDKKFTYQDFLDVKDESIREGYNIPTLRYNLQINNCRVSQGTFCQGI